jgi:c-di-GMP-binding flagellar brake protein YcgR
MAIDPNDLSIHDELVIETEIDGASVALPAFITNILAEELWLATRLPEPRLVELSEGQAIHLTFDRGGALIVESTFLRRLGAGGRLGMEKSRVFAVRRPQGVQTVQRRAHVRVDLERNVRIRALGSLGTEKMGNGRTINIGAGGVQFRTDMLLLFGEQLRLALVLTSREIVVVGGTIVRIEDGDGPEPGAPPSDAPADSAEDHATHSKVAVRFDKISEVDQERITVHILSAHRQRAKSPVQPDGLKVQVPAEPSPELAPASAAEPGTVPPAATPSAAEPPPEPAPPAVTPSAPGTVPPAVTPSAS